MKNKNLGLQKKVIIYTFIAGLIAFSIGLAVTYHEVKGAFIKATGRDFAELAEKIAERFDATVKKEILTFQRLAEDPVFIKAVKDDDRVSIGDFLSHYLKHADEREEHINILVVNKEGRVIGNGGLKGIYKIDQSKEIWWQKIYHYGIGQIYASDIYIDKSTGLRAFDICVPIVDPVNGEVIGGIRSIMNVDVFFNFIKEMSFGRTGHGMLIDSDGTPLICSILPLIKHSMNTPLIKIITTKRSGWAVVDDDAHGGKNSVIGFSPLYYVNSLGSDNLGGHKWYTFVRQAPEETFGPVYTIIFKLFVVEFFLVLSLCILGVYIVRKVILKPVQILHEGVDRLSKGDLHHKIDIHTGDELETLATGFNRMGDSLKDLYNSLEKKIRERTAELIASETKYRVLMEQGHDAVFIIDPATGEIRDVNLQAEILTGFARSELVGLYYWNLYPEDMRKSIKEHFAKGVKRGILVLHEVPIRKKNGENVWVDVSGRLVEYSNVRAYHVVLRDISQVKKEEERLANAGEQLARSTMVMLEQDSKLSTLRKDLNYLLKSMNMSEAILTLFDMLADETAIERIAIFEKEGSGIRCRWSYGAEDMLRDLYVDIIKNDPIDSVMGSLKPLKKSRMDGRCWIDRYFRDWILFPLKGRDIVTGLLIAGPVKTDKDEEILKRYIALIDILVEKERIIKKIYPYHPK